MIESILEKPSAVSRHKQAPLLKERKRFLTHCNSKALRNMAALTPSPFNSGKLKAMKKLPLFVLLCAAPVVSFQQSTKSSTTPKPDDGSFVQNTYRNNFFGFSYTLPGEWHKSRVAPAALPSGAYYLFIGDRNKGESLMNRVMVVADPENENRPGLSTQEYLSAYIRAQIRNPNAEVIREPSSFVSGGSDFYRADYKRAENGITIYSSMVCTKRSGYWLSWDFVTPSQTDLDEAVNTLQHISFDAPSPRSR